MASAKADIILHPIRMRIIQCLINDQRLTTQQIQELLTDVPQATLYRHLRKLENAHVIEVVEEHKIRGTVEKVYGMKEEGANITINDLKKMTPEQHMELFIKFISSLLGDFQRYINQDYYDLVEDGISFRQLHLQLSDSEFNEMLGKVRNVYSEYLQNEPSQDRRRRIISTITMPDAGKSK
ncbi:helix-turn-helix domain-containing protein [Neobacillus niacini]|uniref:helix-turn-helix domain-containing protein n=1 Tax=Neobacillus niacini TaxID=86668 RepID=UPI002862AFD8|nr:helix-turn-helix domain-containing protein [Neobacillus niacini]MDR7002734.1 DNA-binding transcriptional ArsR family regulator [Neobacillus niacini]